MPIPPAPMTFRCPKCRWNKRVQPKSDALLIGLDFYTCCPQCSNEDIQMTRHPRKRGLLTWLTGGNHF